MNKAILRWPLSQQTCRSFASLLPPRFGLRRRVLPVSAKADCANRAVLGPQGSASIAATLTGGSERSAVCRLPMSV
jgi:hypothetical protein